MKKHRGIAIVEFAIILVPILTLLFAGIECGLALQRVHAIQRATASAVRLLSLSQAGDLRAIQSAQCLVLTGAPTDDSNQCSGQPILPNTTVSNVQVCDAVLCPDSQIVVISGLGHLNLVTVSTQGMVMNDFPDWMTPILFPAIHTSMVQSLS
jgi:Flp pilus assembly protein TadG